MIARLGRQSLTEDVAALATAGAVPSHRVTAVVIKAGIADNTPTPIFTITTTDETGSSDGGAYACFVRGLAAHGATYNTANAAAVAFAAHFTRAQAGAGGGVLSSVTEDHDDALAATTPANRTINNVALTVAETSEYVTAVSITVDVAGATPTTAEIALSVELLYQGYLTPPAIAPAP